MARRGAVIDTEAKSTPPLGEAETAAHPVPDCEHGTKVAVVVAALERMMDLMLSGRDQQALDDPAVRNPHVGMAQVRPGHVE